MIGELRGDDPALAAWLRARLVFRDEIVAVSEAILSEGDAVHVSGWAEAVAVADGYRNSSRHRLFRERAYTPLIIRRV